VAATLTAGYWTACAARPDCPYFDRKDYNDTFAAFLAEISERLK
jgi:hypothetical protein